jgi:hypothetical protein
MVGWFGMTETPRLALSIGIGKTLSSLSDVPRMAYDWRMGGGDRHVR